MATRPQVEITRAGQEAPARASVEQLLPLRWCTSLCWPCCHVWPWVKQKTTHSSPNHNPQKLEIPHIYLFGGYGNPCATQNRSANWRKRPGSQGKVAGAVNGLQIRTVYGSFRLSPFLWKPDVFFNDFQGPSRTIQNKQSVYKMEGRHHIHKHDPRWHFPFKMVGLGPPTNQISCFFL